MVQVLVHHQYQEYEHLHVMVMLDIDEIQVVLFLLDLLQVLEDHDQVHYHFLVQSNKQ